jgi:hypothetical protein
MHVVIGNLVEAVAIGHFSLVHRRAASAAVITRGAVLVETRHLDDARHHGPVFRQRRLFLHDEREQRDDAAERAERHHQRRQFGIGEVRRDEIAQMVKAERRAEHDRKHDRRSDAETAP